MKTDDANMKTDKADKYYMEAIANGGMVVKVDGLHMDGNS